MTKPIDLKKRLLGLANSEHDDLSVCKEAVEEIDRLTEALEKTQELFEMCPTPKGMDNGDFIVRRMINSDILYGESKATKAARIAATVLRKKAAKIIPGN